MNAVFLDTVGLIALWDVDDQWHAPASTAFERIVAGRQIVITTSFVLLECANAAARRSYRNDVIEVRRELLAAGGVIEPSEERVEAAWSEYRRGDLTEAGIVDLVSFAVMRDLGIGAAFSNDRHFRTAGFTTLF